jgi:hypothetical protein
MPNFLKVAAVIVACISAFVLLCIGKPQGPISANAETRSYAVDCPMGPDIDRYIVGQFAAMLRLQ